MQQAIFKIEARYHNMAGVPVQRILPSRTCRAIGPFVFLDHMGPTDEPAQVAPHPHIGLSTLTWLFSGEMRHRDSLGNDQIIRPGEVNWMTAGRGIVHSERADSGAPPLHGLQCWVAQCRDEEQGEPSFQHLGAPQLPRFSDDGVDWTLIAGHWMEQHSPLAIQWPAFFVEGRVRAPGSWHWHYPGCHALGIYLVTGHLSVRWHDGQSLSLEAGELGVFPPLREGAAPEITADSQTCFVCLGGEPFPEERFFDWNFVASDKALLAQARADWIAGRFPSVPGDDSRIPHPAESS
ncbi:MAG: pirin family protein [Natronospirillum sp.]|uniref:pirin family protein n=1 Tax=Natronospirillum sp. TaxID=2812955 RepID=UPI0025FF4DC5|nr:pirin family protein [Natronospirillum sp.]MCH8551218.1 pirin family protein [Natronospirillum sp.]